MFTSLQTSCFQKFGSGPADLDEAAGQMFRAHFLSYTRFYGMMILDSILMRKRGRLQC